ncbi:MAG: thiamine pyrophosphate-dependent enzyme, partial [Propioniciclava sp.]
SADAAWLGRWLHADAAVERDCAPTPLERVALAAWEAPGVLLLGSSNTVRAFDAVAPGTERGYRVLGNRGLAGIDGLISTAHGLAAGLREPVRVVLGDLSFAHDVGGLGRGTQEGEPDLDVVVVNDHGGGIFGGLEHGRAPRPLFERFFAAGQVLDPLALARGFGAQAVRVEAAGVAEVLASYAGGRRVVEVPLPPV